MGRRPVMADNPDLMAAMRLLDAAKDAGFTFQRLAPGPDGPLRGMRESIAWQDEIYLGGFANACHATRRRRWSLIVPGGLPVTQRVDGGALTVLHTVVSDWGIE
ncbi:MAG: hypothetical protein JO296_16600 [Pseudonocardiales bacterium]|nr:hypothetical protein [Pseudonocardiales bacterium]